MECIKCKTAEENKGSGLCDACEKEEMCNINGLLYLPAMGLIIGVIVGATDLYGFIETVFNYFNETGFLSYYAIGALVFLTLGFIVSLYAAWVFFRRRKGTRKVMVIYYVTDLIVSSYLTVFPTIVFNAHLGLDSIRLLLGGIAGVIIWVPYFIFSKRINMVFCR